jgi:hypothetical protein
LENNEDYWIKVRYILVYIDGVEQASIYCGDRLLRPGESASFQGATIHASPGWHSYNFIVTGEYYYSTWYWSDWIATTWEYPAKQIYVPSWWDVYGAVALIVIAIATVVAILAIYLTIVRKRRPKLAPPPQSPPLPKAYLPGEKISRGDFT